MSEKRMHLICNAHIDPVWLWNRTEGIGAAISTFRTAVRICKKYGHFVFNHNEAVLYEYIENYDSALFEEIKELVAEGKWNIMGGWYLQPDCNMLCGESVVRQAEVGQRFFYEKFGVKGFNTAINFDPFGHTRGLVQIFEKAGYKNYVIIRPAVIRGMDESPHHKVIEWHGFNNSKIYVLKSQGYCTPLGRAAENAEKVFGEQSDVNITHTLWGLGDHGGGPSERDMACFEEFIAKMKEKGVDVIHSTPDAFFDDFLANEKPQIQFSQSLQPHAVGCYTTMTRVKAGNRMLENQLLAAEKAVSTMLANGIAKTYPHDRLEEAWKDLLFTQFHDALPGTSIQQVENDILRQQDRGLQHASDILMKAFFEGCGGQTPPRAGEQPILVFNPHPYEIEETVECEYMLEDQIRKGGFTTAEIYDEQGSLLPSQNEKESSNIPIDWAKKVVFNAKLAPMSVSRFNLRSVPNPKKPMREVRQAGGKIIIDTEKIYFEFDTASGLVTSYKVDGFEYLNAPAGKLLVMRDSIDPWEMRVNEIRDCIGEFVLASPKKTAKICGAGLDEMPPVRIVESGDIRVIIEAVYEYGDSALCARYTVPLKGAKIGVNLRVFSMERCVMLKYSIPTVICGGEYTTATTFGRDSQPSDGAEAVGQGWVMLSDAKRALAVTNTKTYGSDCCDGEIRMSVLRTPGYSAHPIDDLRIVPDDRLTPYIDIGERLFDYAFEGGEAGAISEKVDYEALIMNQPVMALSYHPTDSGEKAKPFCSIEDKTLQLVTIKPSLKGGYIMRLYNALPRKLEAEVKFPVFGTSCRVNAEPLEIITLEVDARGNAAPTDLLDI